MNTFRPLTTLAEVAEFCKTNVEDLAPYVRRDDEDSEYFSGVQSAYIQIFYEVTGEWLKATEPGEPITFVKDGE